MLSVYLAAITYRSIVLDGQPTFHTMVGLSLLFETFHFSRLSLLNIIFNQYKIYVDTSVTTVVMCAKSVILITPLFRTDLI